MSRETSSFLVRIFFLLPACFVNTILSQRESPPGVLYAVEDLVHFPAKIVFKLLLLCDDS